MTDSEQKADLPSSTVLVQLNAVRETGEVNMHDRDGVRAAADEIGLVELVWWLDSLDAVPKRNADSAFYTALRAMGYKTGSERWIDLDIGGFIWIPRSDEYHVAMASWVTT